MCRRFTPAYAGKIESFALFGVLLKVHPRIRGEDLYNRCRHHRDMGSPPHTRGRSPQIFIRENVKGFTPAYAGKIPP